MRPKTRFVTHSSDRRPPRIRRWMMMLACGLLGINVVIGDRVPLHSLKFHTAASSEHQRLEREIEQLRRENHRMRDEARKLREDPATIEAIARRELGLIRPGEVVFLLTEEPPTRRLRTR